MKSSRGAMGIRADDITKVLAKAGWQARQGAGDHIVLSKPGEQQIVLTETVTMAQWKNVERSVGMQVEHLLHKQRRGPGARIPEAELRNRLGLAKEMLRAGFPGAFIRRHAGLSGMPKGVTLGTLEQVGVEGVVQQYSAHRIAKPAPTLSIRQVPEEAVRTGLPLEEWPKVAEAIAPPAEQHDGSDIDAILDLMKEMVGDVRGLMAEKKARDAQTLSIFRHAWELRQGFEKLLDEMTKAWKEE